MKTIKQWLKTIADKKIREAAISQIDEGSGDIQVNSLLKALGGFNLWINTKEGWKYWNNVFIEVENGTLQTREVEEAKPTDHVKDDQHRVTIKYSFDELGREICDIKAKGTKDDILNSLGMFWGLEIKENVNPYILTQSINEKSAKAFSNFKISSEPMTDEEAREATELEKPFSSWYGEEKLGFSYDMDKLTPEYKEDGTIILKPKKRKVWIEVYFSAIDDSICTTEHFSKEELKESIEVGKEDGDTLLEVIEREYEI